MSNCIGLTISNMRNLSLFFLLILGVAKVVAHPMPNSIVNLSVLDQSIKGEVKIPLLELESAIGQSVGDINSAFFRDYFAKHIIALSENQTWDTKIENLQILTDHDPIVGDYQEVVVHFKMTPRNIFHLRHFTFRYDAVIHQVVTHEIMVFLQYDWGNGMQEGSGSQSIGVIELDVPTGKILPLEVNLDEGSWWEGFVGMFYFGMKHIRQGLDHILFLLTLLLIAPLTIEGNKWSSYQGVKYTLSRFLKISLAFTIGHSVTLLVGSFNMVNFRVQYVEILIAISIFISAINCIKPIFFKKEILISGGFGLIHGLAFSISLSHLELGFASKIISILGFNLGIEAMQLIIMACFFPLLASSKWKFYSVLRTVFAICTLIVSIAWVVERVNNQENMVTAYVNSLL
jgi:HupE / UreJ protein